MFLRAFALHAEAVPVLGNIEGRKEITVAKRKDT